MKGDVIPLAFAKVNTTNTVHLNFKRCNFSCFNFMPTVKIAYVTKQCKKNV